MLARYPNSVRSAPALLARHPAPANQPRQDQTTHVRALRASSTASSLSWCMEERVFGTLPDETWVYPGHGDDTTLAPSGRTAGVARRGW